MSLTAAGRFTHQDVANSRIFEVLNSNRNSSQGFFIQYGATVTWKARGTWWKSTRISTFTMPSLKWEVGPRRRGDLVKVSYYRGRDNYEYDYETRLSTHI